MRECRKCAGILKKYNVEPRPIFSGGAQHPIFLLGQAPGVSEYNSGKPFQGAAGKSVRNLFSSCGLKSFDDVVYQTSVTKCFPGRLAKASSDRKPGVSEVVNCASFLRRQLEIVNPRLMVCLGGLAWQTALGLLEQERAGFLEHDLGLKRPNQVKVLDVVGRVFRWRSTTVIPMIHPSGSANGARSEHPDLDQLSKKLLAENLIDF